MSEFTSATFLFTDLNIEKAREISKWYPEKRSAIMPLLHLVQEQHGWIPDAAAAYVAEFLQVPQMQVFEVASFYTMYNRAPVGKHVVEVCKTTPCWLSDCDSILSACKETLKIEANQTTEDGLFTLKEVECLGACKDAPLMTVDGTYYTKMTPEKCAAILQEIMETESGNIQL